MKITILTLFPDMFRGPFDESIVKRAKEKRLVDIKLINIRDFATDRYKSVDDHPYGGGHGNAGTPGVTPIPAAGRQWSGRQGAGVPPSLSRKAPRQCAGAGEPRPSGKPPGSLAQGG